LTAGPWTARFSPAEAGPDGLAENVFNHLNDRFEDFVPLLCGGEQFVLNKAGSSGSRWPRTLPPTIPWLPAKSRHG
jgi:hypothetical protein